MNRLPGGVWHISREYEGIAEAGGVKDVVAGLASSLHRSGTAVTVVLPRYGFIDPDGLAAVKLPFRLQLTLPVENRASQPAVQEVEVYETERQGVRIFLLDSAHTRDKGAVYTYTEEEELKSPERRKGSGHWDAHHLNLTLQLGALELALYLAGSSDSRKPEVFHCHDGHSAFLPAIMREQKRFRENFLKTRAVVTIHNAGWGYHQEIYGMEFARGLTGLKADVLSKGLLPEKKECIDPLLLSAYYAAVNTVSEEYAGEIMSGALEESTGGLGAAFGKAGLTLTGITNGIDLESYDPRTAGGSSLPCTFNPLTGDLGGKKGCRLALYQRLRGEEIPGIRSYGTLGLESEEPLYTFVGRLTGQKGVDILTGAVSLLLCRRAGARFLLLGQGERELEERLISLASELPARKRFQLLLGYNSEIARLIFAAGDFFLIPSLYEPCGLTDFIAQLMGNLPIVHRVGGLAKVQDGFNGFSYNQHSVMELAETVMRTLELFNGDPETLTVMRSNAFSHVEEHYTWEKVLKEHYLPFYRLQVR